MSTGPDPQQPDPHDPAGRPADQSPQQPAPPPPGQPLPPGYYPPGYQQPGDQEQAYQQPGYQQPAYPQPGAQQPGAQQPAYQQPGYQQPGYPMARPLRPDEEKLWAVAAHLGPLLLSFVAPLVVWLVFKDRSQYLDRTGKEALNMQISYALYFLVAGISVILLIGLLLLPVVGLAWLILMIVATVKVANHEEYRYPAIIRFIN